MRGSIAHTLLETLDFAGPEPPGRRGGRRARRPHGVEVTRGRRRGPARDRRRVRRAHRCASAWRGAAAVRREAGFAFSLEPGGGGPLVNGFVDVIATEPAAARLIVDYKTDRLDGADPADVLDRDYATQRTVYALAALRDGAPRVDVAYCFLERPGEPVVRGYTAADADALAEQVVSLARGVLDERYAVDGAPAPRALRGLPGPACAVLVVRGAHARAAPRGAPRRPPAPSPAAAARRSARTGAGAPQVDHRVELRPEQQHEVRQPQPDEQDHRGRERAVGRLVGAEVRRRRGRTPAEASSHARTPNAAPGVIHWKRRISTLGAAK